MKTKTGPSGTLTTLLAFEAPQQASTDRYGRTRRLWTPKITAWTQTRYLRGTESVFAARLAGVQPMVLTTRDCAALIGIDATWRVVNPSTGDIFNIRAAHPAAERGFLDILATKGDAV